MSMKSVLGDVAFSVGAGCVAGVGCGIVDGYRFRGAVLPPNNWLNRACEVGIWCGVGAIGGKKAAMKFGGAYIITEIVYAAVTPYFQRLFPAPIPPAPPINGLFLDHGYEQEMREMPLQNCTLE
jgi:hypothetical protein